MSPSQQQRGHHSHECRRSGLGSGAGRFSELCRGRTKVRPQEPPPPSTTCHTEGAAENLRNKGNILVLLKPKLISIRDGQNTSICNASRLSITGASLAPAPAWPAPASCPSHGERSQLRSRLWAGLWGDAASSLHLTACLSSAGWVSRVSSAPNSSRLFLRSVHTTKVAVVFAASGFHGGPACRCQRLLPPCAQ